LRSMTVSVSSGTCFDGLAGSGLVAEVTRAMDSSGAMATLCGGPWTAAGTFNSTMTLGGETLRSSTVAVSPRRPAVAVRSTFADTTIWARAVASARTIAAAAKGRMRRSPIIGRVYSCEPADVIPFCLC
jgi:hypothetical protein